MPTRYLNSTYSATLQTKAANVHANDTNVPMVCLFNLGTAYRSDGLDIVVTTSLGVLIPRTISAVGDGTFAIYYRDPAQTISGGGTELFLQWGGSSVNVANDLTTWQDCYGSDGDHILIVHGEETSADLVDESGNYTATDANIAYSQTGIIRNAPSFNGNNSVSDFGDITQFNSVSSFSITTWIKQDALGTYDIIFSKYINSTNRIQVVTAGGLLYINISNTTGSYATINQSSIITAGQYCHLCITFDGGAVGNSNRLKLSVDGVAKTLSYIGLIPATSPALASIPFTMGSAANAVGGDLDEFRIFTGALSENQIKTQYDNQNGFNTNASLNIGSALPFDTEPIDTACRATIRQFKARVTVHWGGSLIDPVAITSSTKNSIYSINPSLLSQVTDSALTVPYKWLQCDNLTPLNQMYVAPGEVLNYQVGWWGNAVSDGSGDFTAAQTLIVDTPTRPVTSLLVSGDSAYNQYPVDFTINIYSSGTLKHTEVVTGNALLNWTKSITTITDATRFELIITKWSAASAVVKISEFYTSISEVYDGDEIMDFNILEEMELKDATIPTGNISANELTLSLNNIDNKFFPNNTNAPYHNAIRTGRKIVVELGVVVACGSIEYVDMGTFWSGDWIVGETKSTATTTALDRMGRLQTTSFNATTIYKNTSVGALAEVVLENAKLSMPDLTYVIDASLYGTDYIIPIGWLGEQNHFDALKSLAGACLGRVFCDRTDVIQFLAPIETTSYDYTITGDNYYTKDLVGLTQDVNNVIVVKTQPLTKKLNESVLTSQEYTMSAGETKTYKLKFKKAPAEDWVTTLSAVTRNFVGTVSAAIYTASTAEITVTCTTEGAFTIGIEATLYEVEGEELIELSDEDSIFEYNEHRYELKENGLVQTDTLASKVALSLLSSFKDPYKDLNLVWRGNPEVVLNDVIRVPEYQDDVIDVRGNFTIYYQKFNFDGTLKVNLRARRSGDYAEDYQKTIETPTSGLEWSNKISDTYEIYQRII